MPTKLYSCDFCDEVYDSAREAEVCEVKCLRKQVKEMVGDVGGKGDCALFDLLDKDKKGDLDVLSHLRCPTCKEKALRRFAGQGVATIYCRTCRDLVPHADITGDLRTLTKSELEVLIDDIAESSTEYL